MQLIYNNPFRTLGVFCNSPAREIVGNVSKAKAYLKVGRVISFQSDLNTLLPPLQRTAGDMESALALINPTRDRLRYALFWFAKGTVSEEVAFGHLYAGDLEKAKAVLEQFDTHTALLDRAIIALLERDIRSALGAYLRIIHDDDLRTQFTKAVCDTNVTCTAEDLNHILTDALLDAYPASEVLAAFDPSAVADIQYARAKATQSSIDTINAAIAVAKKAPQSAEAQYEAGRELIVKTQEAYLRIKYLIGAETQYQIVADSLARQILQCGISYYNTSSDPDRARKAMKLQGYACHIAVGDMMKQRCQDNVNILQESLDALPPENLLGEAKAISALLAEFRKAKRDIPGAIVLLEKCEPHLVAIRTAAGAGDKFYLRQSTEVEETVLGTLISLVNEATDKFNDGRMELGDYRDTLEWAWEATLGMEKMDIEPESALRFAEQRKSLLGLLKHAEADIGKASTTITMKTEDEMFDGCVTKDDYRAYLRKYPDGKHKDAALDAIRNMEIKEEAERQRRKAEKEAQEARERRKIEADIRSACTLTAALALYPCKYADLRRQLDDKCFSLCRTSDDYKLYSGTFGRGGIHYAEAEKHLVLVRLMDMAGKHKELVFTLIAVVIFFIVMGLIFGPIFYAIMLWGTALVCGAVSFKMFDSCDNSKVMLAIVLAVVTVVCATVGFAVYSRVQDAEQELKDKEDAERREGIEYDNVLEFGRICDCTAFLADFPDSKYRDNVLKIYYGLCEESGLDELDELADNYGDTRWGKAAKERVDSACDSLYRIALAANTVKGWREYQHEVPGSHYADSQDRIAAIENVAWGTEPKAWAEASAEHAEDAYQKYIQMYPSGAHRKEAESRIIDIQVADIYKGAHGELTMLHGGGGSGSLSSILIKNSTPYSITLLYSGPENRRVTIAANQSVSMTMPNGTYRVGAIVDDASVSKAAGTEELIGGSYNVEYSLESMRGR